MTSMKQITRAAFWTLRKRECERYLRQLDAALRRTDPLAETQMAEMEWRALEDTLELADR